MYVCPRSVRQGEDPGDFGIRPGRWYRDPTSRPTSLPVRGEDPDKVTERLTRRVRRNGPVPKNPGTCRHLRKIVLWQETPHHQPSTLDQSPLFLYSLSLTISSTSSPTPDHHSVTWLIQVPVWDENLTTHCNLCTGKKTLCRRKNYFTLIIGSTIPRVP